MIQATRAASSSSISPLESISPAAKRSRPPGVFVPRASCYAIHPSPVKKVDFAVVRRASSEIAVDCPKYRLRIGPYTADAFADGEKDVKE